MKRNNKKYSLAKIYKELEELNSLRKIQQEALYTCYDECRDYSHIFAIDTIYTEKFGNILSKLKCLLQI